MLEIIWNKKCELYMVYASSALVLSRNRNRNCVGCVFLDLLLCESQRCISTVFLLMMMCCPSDLVSLAAVSIVACFPTTTSIK